MKIQIEKSIGTVKAGKMKDYKNNPNSLNLAACAAAYTAKKLGESVVVIEGNSFMRKIYHIAKKNDLVSKYTGFSTKVKVLLVEPTGECFYAMAE